MGKQKTVEDAMTREVLTLNANDRLTIADDVMRLGRIRHMPVLDKPDGELVGILSQRDLFRGALARSLGYGEFAQTKILKSVRVKEVMSSEVVTVPSDIPLSEAARKMMKHKIGCVVVLTDEGVAGILTEGDFVRMAAEPSS
jgi:CBS domain-containing protein